MCESFFVIDALLLSIPQYNKSSFEALNSSIGSILDSKDPLTSDCYFSWRQVCNIPGVVDAECISFNNNNIIPSRITHGLIIADWFMFNNYFCEISLIHMR